MLLSSEYVPMLTVDACRLHVDVNILTSKFATKNTVARPPQRGTKRAVNVELAVTEAQCWVLAHTLAIDH